MASIGDDLQRRAMIVLLSTPQPPAAFVTDVMEEVGQWPTARPDSTFMNERPLRARRDVPDPSKVLSVILPKPDER